jgi:hypothetical protein
MGSGCYNINGYNKNACTDIISTNCIRWEGSAYPDFDICINDTLTEVITFVLDTLADILEGQGILLPDLTVSDCDYLNDMLGSDEKNLINILKIYKEAICDLNTRILDINTQIADFATVANYDLSCLTLTTDPCDPTIRFHTLIQTIIDALCTLQALYDSISSSILDVIEDAAGNFIQTAVTSCSGNGITVSGTGATTVVTIEALVPPYSPILYTGTLSYFDGTGIGLAGTPMCGWYLCNGANGTPNSTSFPQNVGNTLKYIIRFT